MEKGRPNELIAFGSIRGITRKHFATLWKEAYSNRNLASCDKPAYHIKFIERRGALRLSMWAEFGTLGNWQVEANPSTFAMKLKTDGSMTTKTVERTCKSLCDKFQKILNELLIRNSQDSDTTAEIHCKAALTFEGNTTSSYDIQKNSSKSVRIDQAPKVAYMVWSILLLLNELDIQIRLSEELREHISTTGLVPENLREAKVLTSTKFETIAEWKNLFFMYEDTKKNLIAKDLRTLYKLRNKLANLGDGSLTDLLNPLFEEIEQCRKRYSSQLKQTNAIAANFQRAIKSAEEFLATERRSKEARRTFWLVVVGIFASLSGITFLGLALQTFWTASLKIPQEGTVMEVLMGLVSRILQLATLQAMVMVAIVGVAILVVLIFLFPLVRLAISGASSVYTRYLKVLMGFAQATKAKFFRRQNFSISFSVTRRQQRSFATEIENLMRKMRNNRGKTYLFLSRNASYTEKILLTDLKKIFGELIISEDVATEGSNFGMDDCLESSGTTVIVVGGPVSNLAARCVELKCDCPFDFAFNQESGNYVIRRKKGDVLLPEKRVSGFVQIVTRVPPNGTKADEITIIYMAGIRGIHTAIVVEYLHRLLKVAKTKSILERLITKLNRPMKPFPKAMLVRVKGDGAMKSVSIDFQ